MGLTFDQIKSGFADVNSLVQQSMATWDRVAQSTGLTPTATPPIAAAPSGGAVPAQSQTSGSTPSKPGLLAGNGLLWILGIGAALYALSKMR